MVQGNTRINAPQHQTRPITQTTALSSSSGSSKQLVFPRDELLIVYKTGTEKSQLYTLKNQVSQILSQIGIKCVLLDLSSLNVYLGKHHSKCIFMYMSPQSDADLNRGTFSFNLQKYEIPDYRNLNGLDSMSVSTFVLKSIFPMKAKKIHFYNQSDPFYEFTNFYQSPITLRVYNDKKGAKYTFPTTEHYFQAMKFSSPPNYKLIEQVSKLQTPRDAFNFPRQPNVQKYIRSDWDMIKDDVMLTALYEKFSSNMNLKRLILSTGESSLVEHTTNDSYWGDGGDGSGLNRLGYLLSQVRFMIKNNISP